MAAIPPIRNSNNGCGFSPSPSQPGTLADQIMAVVLSMQLADESGTSAADQFEAARSAIRKQRKRIDGGEQ